MTGWEVLFGIGVGLVMAGFIAQYQNSRKAEKVFMEQGALELRFVPEPVHRWWKNVCIYAILGNLDVWDEVRIVKDRNKNTIRAEKIR